jgi:hypothetical protein
VRRVSRRRLLAAGIAGMGTALVAPGRSLLAIAGGADRPAGPWSVVAEPGTGRLAALVGRDGGPAVHALDVGSGGRLTLGARLWDPVPGLVPIALGATPSGVVVIATGAVTETVATTTTELDALLTEELLAEPGSPLSAPATATERIRSVAVAVPTGMVAEHPGPGLVSAMAGRWVVRQHGPDDEADHLPSVSVARDRAETVVFDDLGLAGAARLGGPVDAPVLSVADGLGVVHVHRLGSDRPLPQLEDAPLVAVTAAGGSVVATGLDPSGHLVLRRAGGDRWADEQRIDAPPGVREVLPVAGASAFVVISGTDAVLIDVGELG